MQYLLETKQFVGLSELQKSDDVNTGMKLKLSLAERGKLVTAQLFEYIMSAYEAVSPIMIFRNNCLLYTSLYPNLPDSYY